MARTRAPLLPLGDAVEALVDLAGAARFAARLALQAPALIPYAPASPSLLLERRARRNARDLALAYRDRRYTWAEVNQHANRYAAWFAAHGVSARDVVAIVMDNRPEFLFALHGLSKLGAIGALVNTQLVGAALAHAIGVSGAKRVLASAEHAPHVEALRGPVAASARPAKPGAGSSQRAKKNAAVTESAPLAGITLWVERAADGAEPPASAAAFPYIDDEIARQPKRNRWYRHIPTNKDVFCFIYTSGTTGLPKAAVIKNQRMLGANLVFGQLMHRAAPGDVIYVPLPLFHSNGLFLGWGSALATGAAVALRAKFSVSQFWSDVREFHATSFVYIGELCRYLLQAPVRPEERQHAIRVAVGNGLRPEIWQRFQDRFGIPVIREFYGSTEGNAPTMNWRGKPGMIGRLGRIQEVIRCDAETGQVARNPRGFCDRVEIGESGLLVGKISTLMTFDGYVDAKATEQKILTDVFVRGDRYFNSGDLVELHPGGWLSFQDRLGDTYRWKGENVSTQEVAEILHEAPGVLDANVFGVTVPHADGRAGMAALRVKGVFKPEAFARYAKSHLAVAQRPLFVRVLRGDMQLTSTFKPKKGEYRKDGYDLARVSDPLYVLRKGRYVKLTPAIAREVASGQLTPG